MNRKLLFLLIFTAIVVFAFYKLFGAGFDWSLFVSSLWHVQPAWLLASIIATLLTYVVRAFRWQVLLNPLKSIPMGPLISINVLGFCAIYLIGRAGELVRPLWLTRSERVPLTVSVATIVVERVLDTLMLIAAFGLALLLVKLPSAAEHTMTLMKDTAWVMVGGSIVTMVFLFFFRSNVERIVGYIPIARLTLLLRSFSEGLSFLDRGRTFGLVIAHSIVVWIVIVLQFWFMLLGMNFRFSVAAATLVMVGSAIGSLAQVPGVGGGFQAGYIFCMTTFFIVPAEQAIATSLVAWVSSIIPTLIVGGFYMVSHGLSVKDLRAMPVEVK
jgi:glycosyltransferase 2 family protein